MKNTRTIFACKSSGFNTTESKDYFINDCCYGDDFCRWLAEEFLSQGLKAESDPGQEDFGWYFNVTVKNTDHTVVIVHRPPDDSDESSLREWLGFIERDAGFIASLLGARNRGILPEVAQLIHSVLSSSPLIKEIKWHYKKDFDHGKENLGSTTPE